MRIARRAALALLAAPVLARAAGWPERPIRLLHGFGPGGPADTMSRLIAAPLSEALGQPVVVEARPGAGGNIASAAIARAAPDGYTLGLITGGHAVNAAFGQTPGFDPIEDFDFIALLSRYAFTIVVRQDFGARDLAGLIALAKQAPGSVTFASAGTGSTQHLTGELLASAAGVRFTHVPYRGDAPATTALLGGEVAMMVGSSVGTVPHVRSGALRALAVTSPMRSPLLPEVPTLAEAGLPGAEATTWAGLVAPRGLPAPIGERLYTVTAEALAEPGLRRRLEDLLGGEVGPGAPGEMKRLVASEIPRWRAVIEQRGIKLD